MTSMKPQVTSSAKIRAQCAGCFTNKMLEATLFPKSRIIWLDNTQQKNQNEGQIYLQECRQIWDPKSSWPEDSPEANTE